LWGIERGVAIPDDGEWAAAVGVVGVGGLVIDAAPPGVCGYATE
jgi:hypothetical protein